jgi:leader peptidase (prepilin peptidase)/N-methyltransferase
MTMGAMLGFHRIFIALVLAILFGGLFNFALIAIRKRDMKSHVAYGPYLAYAGMIMIIWGTQIYEWYVG